jgi:ATP phosphoribosyltransferase
VHALGTIGIEVDDTGGEFADASNFPVRVLFFRDGDIPGLVDNKNTPFAVGLAGSDSTWEALGQEEGGMDRGNEFPIYELKPNAKRSRLYVGVTPQFRDSIESGGGSLDVLGGSMVGTGLPRITRAYFGEQGVQVTPFVVSGSDELLPNEVPGVNAVLGVINRGTATRRCGIEVVRDPIHVVTMRELVRQEKMDNRQRGIYSDIQSRMADTLENRSTPRRTLVAAGLL